jgi:RNA polymerase sigma-70 factor (ECF subfamily)
MRSGPARRDDVPEPDAFAAVYDRYYEPVWRTLACLGVPAATLDDAVQEVFLVVHRRLGDPARYGSLKSWIYAIARRVAWHHHRSQSRQARRLALVRPADPLPSPEQQLERSEALEIMARFLDALPPEQREVFVLAEIEGLPAPDIARIVEAPLNTVYSRLRLARSRFEETTARMQARIRREERDA